MMMAATKRQAIIVKLACGQEVVGEVVSLGALINPDGAGVIVLRHPFSVNYRYGSSGLPAISLVKYSFFGESPDVWFPIHQIITTIVPREPFARLYFSEQDQSSEVIDKVVDHDLSEYVASNEELSDTKDYTQILNNMKTTTAN